MESIETALSDKYFPMLRKTARASTSSRIEHNSLPLRVSETEWSNTS